MPHTNDPTTIAAVTDHRRSVLSRCRAWSVLVGSLLMLVASSMVPPSASASVTSCAAATAGLARVVVVVDRGEGDVSVVCVVVPRGSTGSQVLAARAAQLGAAVPSHAGSGLLCTIDSFPSSGCAETASGSYWANFSGTTGEWAYSNYNPFIRRVCDGDVEGWRYVVHGSGSAVDALPRINADSVAVANAWGCNEPEDSRSAGTGSDAASSSAVGADTDTTILPTQVVPESENVDGSGVVGTDGRPSADAGANVDGAYAGNAVVVPTGTVPPSQSASTSWIGVLSAGVLITALGTAAFVRSRRAS